MQKSLDDRDDKPTENRYTMAVIDHGKAPKNAGYEYAILVENATEEPSYQRLSKNNALHAVKDIASQQEGYAYFEAYQGDVGGVIVGADKPLMALAHPDGERLSLSIVNPDLAFYQGVEADQVDKEGKQIEVSTYSRSWWVAESQPQTSILRVKGQWQFAEKSLCASLDVQDGVTNVMTTTTHAIPCKLILKPHHL